MPINSDDPKHLGDAPDSDARRSDHVAVPNGGAAAESWIALCAQAAVEQDPRRLLELVKQINFLLDARRQRLVHETGKLPAPKPQLGDGKVDGRSYEPK